MANMSTVGLPRVAPKGGTKFDNTFFPEGTILSCNPYVLHTSKSLWGPDAAEYNPDRWLSPNAASLEKLFCPWGAGWASCPGQHIARIQMSKMAVSLLGLARCTQNDDPNCKITGNLGERL